MNASTNRNSYFFVKFTGLGPVDVGRKVQEYFDKYTSYKISTNTIRSLVETSVQGLHERGNIFFSIYLFYLIFAETTYV